MDFDHHLEELSSSSQCIPSSDDFRFYYNFTEFRRPIEEIAKRSQSMLNKIGSSEHIWGRGSSFPVDVDDAYEWLVNANDDVLELVDELVDEFEKVMKEYEGENGSLKKKKEASHLGDEMNETKPKVSFHVSTLRKPQYHYNIVVNNANQPFEHFLLQKSDDGLRFIHPLEKFSVLDFVDKENLENLVPVRPLSLESTPFKLVEEVQGLKELAAKLCSVNEFAVDLEHNQYRSFQGLTCLMQISTRSEDFVVDTLKLRNHVGPYLREVFKDPTKKKVMHGANRDIVWLQRDFGIYVCNMFDTGQASRVLKLERYSLQYLLQQFCGVTANKEYQNADWRVRPIPDVMLRYGREDTHYLLYIYDLMRIKLFALPKESESSDDPLVEVYKRSYDVCMQLYEKELLTEDSYLRVKGLRGAGFNAQQLAIVSGLCEWRDVLARAEDESTGYILPNKIILEIAKQMPVTTSTLRRLVGRSKLSYVERSLDIIVNIVRHSMQNAAAFEEAALRLKEEHAASVSNVAPVKDETEAPLPHSPNLNDELNDECAENGSFEIENATCVNISENSLFSSDMKGEHFEHEANVSAHSTAKGNGANVQVRKMPTGACDATLPGNSASEGKCDTDKKGKEEIKVEQIRSPVNLPCHPFLGNNEKSKLVLEAPTVASETSDPQKPLSGSGLASTSTLDGIIPVDLDSDSEDMNMMQNNL